MLDRLVRWVNLIFLGEIMSKLDEINAELVKINETTNEIASDIDTLILQLSGGLSASDADTIINSLKEKSAALRSVAEKYTPESPVPEEPATEEPAPE